MRLCCFSDTYWNAEGVDSEADGAGAGSEECQAVSKEDGAYDDEEGSKGRDTKPDVSIVVISPRKSLHGTKAAMDGGHTKDGIAIGLGS